jgi:hypothetical protein
LFRPSIRTLAVASPFLRERHGCLAMNLRYQSNDIFLSFFNTPLSFATFSAMDRICFLDLENQRVQPLQLSSGSYGFGPGLVQPFQLLDREGLSEGRHVVWLLVGRTGVPSRADARAANIDYSVHCLRFLARLKCAGADPGVGFLGLQSPQMVQVPLILCNTIVLPDMQVH